VVSFNEQSKKPPCLGGFSYIYKIILFIFYLYENKPPGKVEEAINLTANFYLWLVSYG